MVAVLAFGTHTPPNPHIALRRTPAYVNGSPREAERPSLAVSFPLDLKPVEQRLVLLNVSEAVGLLYLPLPSADPDHPEVVPSIHL